MLKIVAVQINIIDCTTVEQVQQNVSHAVATICRLKTSDAQLGAANTLFGAWLRWAN